MPMPSRLSQWLATMRTNGRGWLADGAAGRGELGSVMTEPSDDYGWLVPVVGAWGGALSQPPPSAL